MLVWTVVTTVYASLWTGLVAVIHLCLSVMPGPILSARQLVHIWQVSCRQCPEAYGAPAVHQGEVRLGMRQTPQQVTAAHSTTHCPNVLTTMAVCDSCSWVCPADQIADDNQRGCSVSFRYMCGSTMRYQSFVESVTQLLSDCYADLTHTANGTVSSAAVAVQSSKLAHAGA